MDIEHYAHHTLTIAKRLGIGEPWYPQRLQKVIYFTDGWNLAWDHQRAFAARAEARACGPVYPALASHIEQVGAMMYLTPDRFPSPPALEEHHTHTLIVALLHYGVMEEVALADEADQDPTYAALKPDPRRYGTQPKIISTDKQAAEYALRHPCKPALRQVVLDAVFAK